MNEHEQAVQTAKEECLRILRDATKDGDTEKAHIAADGALCAFLSFLGHKDVADLFDEVEKWYA